MCQTVADQTSTSIVLSVQATDIKAVADAVSLPVFAQHVDGVGYGSHTGHMLPQAVKAAGATGTLLNHSEDPYDKDSLKAAIDACKEQGLYTICCAPTTEASAECAKLGPDAIAVEPPELIGSGISVSTAQPELVTATVDAVKQVAHIPVLTGAGVVTDTDVSKALELGTKGVLLASGVLKAENPEQALRTLLKGLTAQ